jgi:hypothetical protein
MQRFSLTAIAVFTIVLCLVAPAALADGDGHSFPVFSSQMICDTNGDNDFSDTKGFVTIFKNGNVLIDIPRLARNKVHRIILGCAVGNKFISADRSTNSRGRLLSLIPDLGSSGALETGCALPAVTVFPADFSPGFCYAGYGQP